MLEFTPKKLLMYGLCLGIGGLILLFTFTCRDAATDVFVRYAPMAEAFAVGNWSEAFHPRFGVGFQVITGLLVFLSGGFLDGWDACLLVSSLALLLSLFPLFRLLKRVFDEATAWAGVLLVVICPQILLWVARGLRESFRMLGLLLLCDAIFACKDQAKGRGLLSASLGTIILCSIRVDTILAAFFLIGVYFLVDRFSKRSIFLGLIALLAIQPTSFLVWKWTGWWMPAIQYVGIIQKILG